jgi:MFS family permease
MGQSGMRLTAVMCAAEVLGMLNFATFQALIPTFLGEWSISNTEAGWISGAYFAGYVIAVPLLVGLTDRADARDVLLASLALGAAASAAFAAFADGFWPALLLRAIQGVGLAGTYMTGLKALTDRVEGPAQSRYIAFYTASFGIGASLSFVAAGEAATLADWRLPFLLAAGGSAAAFAMVLLGVRPQAAPAVTMDSRALDFLPVLRNRTVMAFIWGYAGHNWELFALRSWLVAFLVYAESRHPGAGVVLGATSIAALSTLLGVPASIFGNEFALRIGRKRWILAVAAASVALACVIGFASALSYGLVVALALLYGILAAADSAALTSGTVAAAEPGRRGATLAVHASLGFVGGIFGPLSVGVALDLAGDGTVLGWGLGFVAVGFGSAVTFAAVLRR